MLRVSFSPVPECVVAGGGIELFRPPRAPRDSVIVVVVIIVLYLFCCKFLCEPQNEQKNPPKEQKIKDLGVYFCSFLFYCFFWKPIITTQRSFLQKQYLTLGPKF